MAADAGRLQRVVWVAGGAAVNDYTADDCMDLAHMCAQVALAYRLPVARSWHCVALIRQEIRAYQDAAVKWVQDAQRLQQVQS